MIRQTSVVVPPTSTTRADANPLAAPNRAVAAGPLAMVIDRILPNDKSLYLTIAGAGADFGPAALEGARLRLIFKPRAEARPEHELDRFTQVRDNYAQLVEEYPNSRRLNIYKRFETDMTDPQNNRGRSGSQRRCSC